MTPYRNAAAGSPERIFNDHHSKTRSVVERAIGVWKSRFRCVLGERALNYVPLKACQIVNVACALHNICIHFRDDQFEPLPERDDVEEIEPDYDPEFENLRSDAERTRQRILATFAL